MTGDTQPENAPGVVHLWQGRLNSPSPAGLAGFVLDHALTLLSSDERARARRMRSAAAHAQFVATRAALRLLLADVAGAGVEGARNLRFRYGRHGKPYLPGGPSFNVSHSADFLAVAVTERGRVGVDVELVRPIKRSDRVAARRFAPAEQAWIATAGPDQRDAAFLRVWTCKEAFAKALGDGLATPYPSFSVDLPSPNGPGPKADGDSNSRFGARGGLAALNIPGERVDSWTVTSLPRGRETAAALAVDRSSVVVVRRTLPDEVWRR